jgi:hypothetical protein
MFRLVSNVFFWFSPETPDSLRYGARDLLRTLEQRFNKKGSVLTDFWIQVVSKKYIGW